MDYSKIDAPLGEALAERSAKDEPDLTVFIQADRDLSKKEAIELKALGVDHDAAQGRIITATVSPTTVDKLSHKPWVQTIKLSQKRRPLGRD
jgi:hypothetical protein